MEQEDDDDQADDDRLLQEVALQRADRLANQSGPVVPCHHFHPRGQRGRDFRQFLLHTFDDVQSVHAIAHHHDAAHSFSLSVPLGHTLANVRTEGHCADVPDKNGDAVFIGHRHLSERGLPHPSRLPDGPPPTSSAGEQAQPSGTRAAPPSETAPPISERERHRILLDAAKQVGPALFFSLLIIVVSFLPVFLLEAQEGRMFRPLAWTKTLAVGFSSVLAVTLVPVLMVLFIRGKKLRPESENPISRFTQFLYLPVLRFCLRHRVLTLLVNLAFLALTVPLVFRIGSQFMPPLFEGSSLYMPTALPGISITQASRLLQEQDRIIRSMPEVESVFGSIGRSDSATDNAPLTCTTPRSCSSHASNGVQA